MSVVKKLAAAIEFQWAFRKVRHIAFAIMFQECGGAKAMVLIVGSAVAPYQIPFTIFHELSGLNALIDAAFPLSSPRSFSYTTPS